MNHRIDLAARGLRLYAGRLYNHDYLWFSSFEISKVASTVPLVHNYALTYAINGYSYGIYSGSTPRYSQDLEEMRAYATPARPQGTPARTRFTQNAINSRTLRTDDAPRARNSPAFGWRLVLNPVWRVDPAASEQAGFGFYLFAQEGFRPPSVMRLGKKGSPTRLEWDEVFPAVATFTESPVQPTHAVNPLDVQGDVVSYEPVPIPPHLVFRVAELQNDWFIFANEHRVHLPLRLAPKDG